VTGADRPEGFDRLYTHVVAVKYADVSEVQQILPSLGSQTATVDAYARTNTLIITDTADGIRRMLEFLEEIDIAGLRDRDRVVHARAHGRRSVGPADQ
jgi:type II secretory pathway component GspD/PulD (secretin)